MTTPTQPTLAGPTPGFAQRKARALVGWLPSQEGALWLAGRQMGTASPEHIAGWERARAFDPTKNAWILSSPNPNLRVVGNFSGPVAPGLTGYGFAVALQKSYLQVAGLGGRYFLRDGYHRAYGLLAAGISHVPALVKDFATFEEVGLPAGLLPQSTYLGERPPLLPDYLNDQRSVDTLLPITQKMVVVQALELHSIG